MRIWNIKHDVRERDGFKCTQCGATNEEHQAAYGRQLDVHRVVPGSVYTVEGCITVCRSCHGKLPKRQSGQPDVEAPPSRANYRLLSIPKAYFDELKKIADERSDEEIKVSVAAVFRMAVRLFLESKGRLPKPRKPAS